MNISFWKKYQLFTFFKKNIEEIELILNNKFNLRVDKSYRLYTVFNIPEEVIGEAFSLRKADIETISETYVREYIQLVSEYLNENNLRELFRVYEVKKIDKYSFLIIMGFSLFQTNKFYDNIYFKLIPFIILTPIIIYILTNFL